MYDANTPAAAKRMAAVAPPALLSELAEIEINNAIGLLLFRKELSAARAASALSLFQGDVLAGLFQIKPIPASAFHRARQIARRETPLLGTRSLDLLHVCSALAFRAELLLTFDRRQASLASRMGLRLS